MRALLAIREQKTLTQLGPWHSGKRMPKAAFPLSRSHSYVLGSSFDWCVSEAVAGANAYRVLVALDPHKAQYRGWLGLVKGHDQALIGRLEFHPSHRGWHCHVKLGPLDKVARGVVKESSAHDKARVCATANHFAVTQLDAISIAFRAFNVVHPQGAAGGLFQ